MRDLFTIFILRKTTPPRSACGSKVPCAAGESFEVDAIKGKCPFLNCPFPSGEGGSRVSARRMRSFGGAGGKGPHQSPLRGASFSKGEATAPRHHGPMPRRRRMVAEKEASSCPPLSMIGSSPTMESWTNGGKREKIKGKRPPFPPFFPRLRIFDEMFLKRKFAKAVLPMKER
jgi:hypothetical protein